MLLGSGAAIGIIARISLGDEDRSPGVDRETIEQRPEGVDDLDQLVGRGVKDIEVTIGDLDV